MLWGVTKHSNAGKDVFKSAIKEAFAGLRLPTSAASMSNELL